MPGDSASCSHARKIIDGTIGGVEVVNSDVLPKSVEVVERVACETVKASCPTTATLGRSSCAVLGARRCGSPPGAWSSKALADHFALTGVTRHQRQVLTQGLPDQASET
jgi:hypothetical protein